VGWGGEGRGGEEVLTKKVMMEEKISIL